MSVTHGNDPDLLEEIGRELGKEADRLEGVGQQGRSLLAVLVLAWAGRDVEMFVQSWRVAEGQVEGASSSLRLAGECAVDQANQQRGASGDVAGLVRSKVHDVVSSIADAISGSGDGLPDLDDLEIPIPDGDTPWVPQGLGWSEEYDLVITSLYNSNQGDEGLLAIQAPDGTVLYVPIEGNDHAGGVTVDGDNVYVTGNGKVEVGDEPGDGSFVQRYSLKDLLESGGQPVEPLETAKIPTGASVTTHDGKMYVVDYVNGDDGVIYEYDLGPGGSVNNLPEPRAIDAPQNMQGAAVDHDYIYVTRSRGDDDPSMLIRIDRSTGEQKTIREDLAPLSQGIVIRGDQLLVTSESAATPYRQDVIDNGLDPQETIQVIPIPR